MKKFFFTILGILLISFNQSFAVGPSINCAGLPGCEENSSITNPVESSNENIGAQFVDLVISNLIQIVAVFAVFALIISGFMYIISGGDEDKAKKSKKWIIWSIVAVLLSVSAWGIINFINSIQIG